MDEGRRGRVQCQTLPRRGYKVILYRDSTIPHRDKSVGARQKPQRSRRGRVRSHTLPRRYELHLYALVAVEYSIILYRDESIAVKPAVGLTRDKKTASRTCRHPADRDKPYPTATEPFFEIRLCRGRVFDHTLPRRTRRGTVQDQPVPRRSNCL
jgi:hypothetical protein